MSSVPLFPSAVNIWAVSTAVGLLQQPADGDGKYIYTWFRLGHPSPAYQHSSVIGLMYYSVSVLKATDIPRLFKICYTCVLFWSLLWHFIR